MLSSGVVRLAGAVLAAFFVTLLIGPGVIRLLTRLKVGQNVYELAPEAHQKKQGTPTMGGLMFAAVSIVLSLLLRTGPFDFANDLWLALVAFALLNLLMGFLDDRTKLRGGKNQGLTERQKLGIQFVLALLFSLYCYRHPLIGSRVIVPFFPGAAWDLGPFYIPVMIFVILCTTNGANFLDGLDGLMGSVSSVICGFFAVTVLLIASQAQNTNLLNAAVLMAAASGALLGYLRFNLHPAKLMMGDTGSMYLGGLVAGVAMAARLPLFIPIIAGLYAASLLSTFIQRWYFRLTKGKRIFKMAPLHHHFELLGVPETKIVSMYIIITAILCLVALLAMPGIFY